MPPSRPKTIDSPLQSPPCGVGASARISGCALADSTGTRFSFPSAKKHSVDPSGDQNGDSLAFVFISGQPATASSGRIQNRSRPSTIAPNTTKRPSGDTRGQLPDVKGGPIVKCVSREGGASEREGHDAIVTDTIVTINPATAIHGHARAAARDGRASAVAPPVRR